MHKNIRQKYIVINANCDSAEVSVSSIRGKIISKNIKIDENCTDAQLAVILAKWSDAALELCPPDMYEMVKTNGIVLIGEKASETLAEEICQLTNLKIKVLV